MSRGKGKRQSEERLKELHEEATRECNYKRFVFFISEFRKKSIRLIRNPKKLQTILKQVKKIKSAPKKKLQILQTRVWKGLKEYQKKCRKFTELTIKNENIDISDRGWDKIHIDHIIPVYHGWIMNISPYLLGMSANLQRLSKTDNQNKGRKQLLLCENNFKTLY